MARDVLKKQIETIRRTGKVNMCDSTSVERLAKRFGFSELAEFVQTNDYVTFIFTGDEKVLPE